MPTSQVGEQYISGGWLLLPYDLVEDLIAYPF